MSESDAQGLLRQYYPNLFSRLDLPAPAQQTGDLHSYPIPRGPMDRPWRPPQTQPSYYYDGRIHEVKATCSRKSCYKSCRLMLLGGGRCTDAGCMCYHAYFDHEGTPISRVHPEDNIWWSLSSYERREILDSMRTGVPRRTKTSSSSSSSSDSGRAMPAGTEYNTDTEEWPYEQEDEVEEDTNWFGDEDDTETTASPEYEDDDYESGADDFDYASGVDSDDDGEAEASDGSDPFGWNFNEIADEGDTDNAPSTPSNNSFGDDEDDDEEGSWFGSGEDDDDDGWDAFD